MSLTKTSSAGMSLFIDFKIYFLGLKLYLSKFIPKRNDSPQEKVNKIIEKIKNKQNGFSLNNYLNKTSYQKRNTMANKEFKNNLGAKKKQLDSVSDDDDFSVGKSEISRQKHRQRYSQLATLLTDKELENYREKITLALKK